MRIISYNIQGVYTNKERLNLLCNDIKKMIKSTDIFIFQEVFISNYSIIQEYIFSDQDSIIKSVFTKNWKYYEMKPPKYNIFKISGGVLIFYNSNKIKQDIIFSEHVFEDSNFPDSLSQKGYIEMYLKKDNIRIIGTHLQDSKYDKEGKTRIKQMEQITDSLNNDCKTIIIGDFNIDLNKIYTDEYNCIYLKKYLDSLKKNKGINIYKSIDSTNDKNNIYDFLMTKNIDYNVEVKVLKEYRHSDHYPIYVVI